MTPGSVYLQTKGTTFEPLGSILGECTSCVGEGGASSGGGGAMM